MAFRQGSEGSCEFDVVLASVDITLTGDLEIQFGDEVSIKATYTDKDGNIKSDVKLTYTSGSYSGENPTAVGVYSILAEIQNANYHANPIQDVLVIDKADQIAPEVGAGFVIDYLNESVSVLDPGIHELSPIDGGSGLESLDVTPGTDVYIRFKETTTHNASDWTVVDIPERPPAPEVASHVSQNTAVVDATMPEGYDLPLEYRLSGGAWQSSNVFDGLDYGREYVFEVRTAATESSFHGEVSTVSCKIPYPYYPDHGDDYVPLPPIHVEEQEEGVDLTVILIIAAATVFTALVLVFVWADRRKS